MVGAYRGRKSREYVNPMMYLRTTPTRHHLRLRDQGGAPTSPDWYRNLTAAVTAVSNGTGHTK
jgi:hypothetical protein